MLPMTARVDANPNGRDFVVGDVHGEFETLEGLLELLEFDPRKDRLFALGDLIDRGPRSTDALRWMEEGRITLSVRGNHEQMLSDRIRTAERACNDRRPWMMHPWFAKEVKASEWPRWQRMVAAMPIGATIATSRGDIGLIHASPTHCFWSTTLRKLIAGDKDTIEAALWSHSRARRDRKVAEFENVPVDGAIHGVRSVLTGHTIMEEPTVRGNVWHIDTGAGSPRGRLTIARIDTYPIKIASMPILRAEQTGKSQ